MVAGKRGQVVVKRDRRVLVEVPRREVGYEHVFLITGKRGNSVGELRNAAGCVGLNLRRFTKRLPDKSLPARVANHICLMG